MQRKCPNVINLHEAIKTQHVFVFRIFLMMVGNVYVNVTIMKQ